MNAPANSSVSCLHTDAVVIGGGLSGLSAAIQLARGGMRVLCLEPRTVMPVIVGESMDWSAPALLAELGLPMDTLIARGAANWKRHVTFYTPDGQSQEFAPGAWLGKKPWNVELRTLHLDRPQIQAAMEQLAVEYGVETLHDRVVSFETEGFRLMSVRTAAGRTIKAGWFVDASGAASRLLARQFQLRSRTYGPPKVALWAHVPQDCRGAGTGLHMSSAPGEYMEWVWEIPIRPGCSSIGYVLPGAAMKAKRARGESKQQIFQQALSRFSRLRDVGSDHPIEPAVTSFRCRAYAGTCGPNWLIVGEAAAQTDPITGNGVTSALRHAAEGSALVLRYARRGRIPMHARAAYSGRVLMLGCFFNSLIERLFYQPGLRGCMGVFRVGRVYTVPAWLTNLIYTRTAPRSLTASLLWAAGLRTLRMAAHAVQFAGRLLENRPVGADALTPMPEAQWSRSSPGAQ